MQLAIHNWQMISFLQKNALPLVCFLGSLFLYILTLAPSVYNLDSAELTTAAATLGIPRSTGYPLYILTGFFWSKIPFWNVGYCLNLYSAFCGALTILFIERILSKLKISPLIRLSAALLLAVSSYFWYLSLIAEVYTLNTAIMTFLIWRMLIWDEVPSSRNLAWFAFAYGLGFTHHGSALLLVPGVIWFVWRHLRGGKLRGTGLIRFAIVAGLPLLLYLYLPLRYLQAPAFNYAGVFNEYGQFVPLDLTSVTGFFQLVSGKGFQSLMFNYPLQELLQEILQFWVHIGRTFWLVGIGPGLLGMWVLFKKDRTLAMAMLLTFLCQMIFFSSYRVVDKQTMFLPSDCIWAIWLAVGLERMLNWLPSKPSARGRTMIQVFGLGLVVLALIWNYPLVDQSHDNSTTEMAMSLLNSLPPDAILIGYWDIVPAIQYFQLVEGIRTDIVPINRFLIGPETLERFVDFQTQETAVYFSYYPRELAPKFMVEVEVEYYYIEKKSP
jgi:hypothetical protein